MPERKLISLCGLLREIGSQFPSNPPRLAFVCLRDFGCCSDVSRYQVPIALGEVLRSSGLQLKVDLAPAVNTHECTALIVRVARALCGHYGLRTDADLHRALHYTVSIFHMHMSPAASSVAQRELEWVSYESFLSQYEPDRILGFRRGGARNDASTILRTTRS
jgi:hypothetical protein